MCPLFHNQVPELNTTLALLNPHAVQLHAIAQTVPQRAAFAGSTRITSECLGLVGNISNQFVTVLGEERFRVGNPFCGVFSILREIHQLPERGKDWVQPAIWNHVFGFRLAQWECELLPLVVANFLASAEASGLAGIVLILDVLRRELRVNELAQAKDVQNNRLQLIISLLPFRLAVVVQNHSLRAKNGDRLFPIRVPLGVKQCKQSEDPLAVPMETG